MGCASKPSFLDNRQLHLVNGDRRLSRLFCCGVNNCTCTSSLARVDLVLRCRPAIPAPFKPRGLYDATYWCTEIITAATQAPYG